MRGNRSGAGPDFLVIGAQRAGTTWLHRVLRKHPKLWLPPVKELHHFDQLNITRTWHDERRWRRKLFSARRTLDLWHIRYLLGRRSDDWYARLFQRAQRKGHLAGEITPAYATLGEDVFGRIRQMNPRIKIIFVMRDPVDRVWSALNNAMKKNKLHGPLTPDDAARLARKERRLARSAYTETIRRLEAVFFPSQLHLCFFDHLSEEPERFVRDLLSFLGVEPNEIERPLPGVVNSAAGSKPIPEEFQRMIIPNYMPMVEELCERFDGPPQKWRDRYQKVLGSTPAVRSGISIGLAGPRCRTFNPFEKS